MRLVHSSLIFSATDLSNFLACPQLSLLNRATALGGPKPPKFDDPAVEVLRQRGLEHERAVLETLDGTVVEIPREDDVEATMEAMRSGAPVIYQGALEGGGWFGRPDILRRVSRPSDLGAWSYEVIDAKLAREARGGALLQLLMYADLLGRAQGTRPETVHLALGGPETRILPFRIADYAAYFRSIRARFLDHASNAPVDLPYAPDPVGHCEICAWQARCNKERHDVDHLSLVADIRKSQRRALEQIGVTTVVALAGLDLAALPALEGTSRASLQRAREQARIQVAGRREGKPIYELLLPVRQGEGLAALPPPSPGDLFFDLEGDPYALSDGIEYLFGYADRDARYAARWSLDRESEKRAFEEFIDFVMDRLATYPDLHIYHFAPYETTAMKRLMGRYATREEELDRLLRGKVFVDLHRVVRQGLRASVESYSIKKLEPFYGFERAIELRSASSALAHFEAWLELCPDDMQDDALLAQIEMYNRDDCLSTLRLQEWLERLRDELARTVQADVPRPEPGDPTPSETVAEEDEAVARLDAALTADVPADRAARTPEQQARWILAQILGFHRREQKASWWEYFRCRDLSDEELIEDTATMGGLEYVGVAGTVSRSLLHRYRFPHQEHPFSAGDKPEDAATGRGAGEVSEIDDASQTIVLKRGKGSGAPHPRALIEKEIFVDVELRQSIRRLAEAVTDTGLGDDALFQASVDLLMRRSPRVNQAPGERLTHSGEKNLDAARRLTGRLDRSVLPIQGPPGSGKTYTGARMILEVLERGHRVGITATSHKVISNLLDEVCSAAEEVRFTVRGIQKGNDAQRCESEIIEATRDNAQILAALTSGEAQLAAGTAWLWSREDMVRSVDVLFIDEAGQFSLANALAVAPAADSLVLLGDPKQLDQPLQGVHPPGSDVSALGHMLGDDATMPANRGLFLEHTWRLHPSICRFTSEIFYAGRLEPRKDLSAQRVNGIAPVDGSGIRFVPVEHEGNRNESPEEVEVVADLVERALDANLTWTDKDDNEHALRLEDILIVAPYNAHVSALAEKLPSGARIGTVDKFQGQEAPVVIYSMATSTAEEAPRGMRFLFSPHRLNVATSRARALAIVVANPALFEPECRTPEQMRLANAFCRLREMATPRAEQL
jgi:uncharacterized protein